jgi:hypothetical protein
MSMTFVRTLLTTVSRIARLTLKRRILLPIAFLIFAFAGLQLTWYDTGATASSPTSETYSIFRLEVGFHNVTTVTSDGDVLHVTARTVLSIKGEARPTSFITTLPSFGDPGLEGALEADHVAVQAGPPPFVWDIVAAATPLSTLAAILAGFVLIAIVAILTFPPRGTIPPNDPLHPLLTAFLTLIVASFLFGVLAGDDSGGGTQLAPLVQGYAISWIFAFGVLQTAIGIAWLLSDYDVTPNVVIAARRVARVTMGILAASLAGVLAQPLFVLEPGHAPRNLVIWGAITLMSLTALPVGYSLYWVGGDPLDDHSLWLLKRLTLVALGFVCLATVCFGVLSTIDEPNVRSSFHLIFSGLAGGQLLFAGLIVVYEMSLPRVQMTIYSVADMD